jgi:two-component system sensor kinase FixL
MWGDVPHRDRTILDPADAGHLGTFAFSRDGVIRSVNPVALRIFGYAEEALLRQHVGLVLPPELQSDRADWCEDFFSAHAATGEGRIHKLHGRRADGSQVSVEMGLGWTGSGEAIQAIAFITEVTRRRQSEKQFEAMLAALPVGLVMIDAAGRIAVTNRMLDTTFGYEPAELLDQNIELLLPPWNHAGQPYLHAERDLIGRHRSGKEFPVEIALCAIQNDIHTGSLVLITDATIRHKLEQALQQANANLEEFTYIAAHDLRSPLRGIADLLDWIEEDLVPAQITDTIKNNFCRAKQRIGRAERMIEDLLTYARASTRNTHKELVNPRALLEEVLESANIPVAFAVTIDAEGASFIAHKTPLQTALRNLIDNARKHHGGESGRISCSFREIEQFYIFAVEDNGQGVPQRAREKIFKLFHRSNSKVEGHGIGLSVTRRMVASHGGRLVLEERSALGGALFRIYWPKIETDDNE